MDNTTNTTDNEMSFLEHLEELRWHLVRSIIAILIGAIAAFAFKTIIFDVILIAPKMPDFLTNRLLCELGNKLNVTSLCINSKPFELISTRMAGQFSTHIMVSLIAGLVISFPVVMNELWRFLKPALHVNERKHARGFVFWSSFLFILGVLFGYYLIAPLSVHFLGNYTISSSVENTITIMSYISTIVSVTLAAGVLFELPIVVYFLTKIGVISPPLLKKYRKHALVVILALSAIITPPDVFSQILVCFPIVLLYEIGIVLSKRITRENA